jgi:deoxycytidylate deaminase
MHIISDDNFLIEVDDFISHNLVVHNSRLKKFLKISKKLACLSDYDKYKLGATLNIGNQIILRGFNKVKSHPLQKQFNSYRANFEQIPQASHSIHAEMVLIDQAIKLDLDLSKAELTVYRIGTDGLPKMGRPCAACMTAIKQNKIPLIRYSTPDGIATEMILTRDVVVKKGKKSI